MEVMLRLSDPGEREALRAFLQKRECRVEEIAPDLLRVGLPHELHDRVWESLHDSRVEIVSLAGDACSHWGGGVARSGAGRLTRATKKDATAS